MLGSSHTGEVRLRIYLDRVDGQPNQSQAVGFVAENLGGIARRAGLTVYFEQAEPGAKCLEVQGYPRDVGRFAERCISLAVDEAIPGRKGWNRDISSEGCRIDITLETFPPGHEPDFDEMTDR